MNKSELKTRFDNILKSPDKIDTRIKKINKLFGVIENDVNREMEKEIKKTIKNYNKLLKLNVKISKKEINLIKTKKIKGKNTKERLRRDRNKLIKTFKKYEKLDIENKEEELKLELKKHYNKSLRIVRNETHRSLETSKDYYYQEAQKEKPVKKVWNCSFRNSRDSHKKLHLKKADENGYFHIGNHKARYPSGFGVAELDINCNCKVKIMRVYT